MMLARKMEEDITIGLDSAPIVAILGPRQSGKSTLVKKYMAILEDQGQKSIYLDLERLSDVAKLSDPELFFDAQNDTLICLDEIQNRPNLFPVIRSHVDSIGRSGQFLITGSASPELLRQSSETLAGRIHLNELTPFMYQELPLEVNQETHMVRGGFPRSLFAKNEKVSFKWRQDFITTFLERDVQQFGMNVPSKLVRRLWRMLAHNHGYLLNYAQLSKSLGVTAPTVKKYIDLLGHTFVIRTLEPYHANLSKRLIKSPKLFIRDTGILLTLLNLKSYLDVLGHPVFGSFYEGYVIENILSEFHELEASFFLSTHGAEIDLILQNGIHKVAIEIKATTVPKLQKGFYIACEDIKPTHKMIIAMVNDPWPYKKDIEVHNLGSALEKLRDIFQL